MRKIAGSFIIFLLLITVGCLTPRIELRKDGTFTIENYAVVQENGSVKNSLVPKPLISVGFADSIVKLAENFGGKIISTGGNLVSQPPVTSPPIINPSVPTPIPIPTPTPVPVPVPTPTPNPAPAPTPTPVTTSFIVFDLNLVPNDMRAYGLGPGSDNAMYYAAAYVAKYGPGGVMSDNGAGSLSVLNGQQGQIKAWIDKVVGDAARKLRADPQATATVIANDDVDRVGCRLGPAVAGMLSEFGSRVILGTIYSQPGC